MKMIDGDTTFVKQPPRVIKKKVDLKSDKENNEVLTSKKTGTQKAKEDISKVKDGGEEDIAAKGKQETGHEQVSTPVDATTFTEALHRLEAVFVETVQKAYDEKDKVQKDTYLNEIDHLKTKNEQLQQEHKKEVSYLKAQITGKEDAFVAEKNRNMDESGKAKQRADRLQSQYDKLKNEYEALLKDQSGTKEKTLIQVESASKERDREKQEKERLQKEVKTSNDEVKRQKSEIIQIRQDLEKLDEQARLHRAELSKAHDEIISLKTTLGSAQSDVDHFQNVSKTKVKSNEQPNKPDVIYFKGARNPLSNMFYVEKGLKLFTHVFYYAETAYQWRSAVYADDFESAEKILNSKDGYEAKDLGSKINKPQGWYDMKEGVMAEILDEKYVKCPEYRESLSKSLNADLIEDTSDDYWARGTYAKPGMNKLGKLHMKKRAATSTSEKPKDQLKPSAQPPNQAIIKLCHQV